MVTVRDVANAMEEWADLSLCESWDNSGLLVGHPDKPVTRILTALDATEAVIEEAVSLGCGMIVTHHPMVFSAVKRFTDESRTGRRVLRLAEEGIALYAAHTNIDIAVGGTNDLLARELGLQDTAAVPDAGENILHLGYLPEEETLGAFCERVKKTLGLSVLRTVSDGLGAKVRAVALCTGSGSEFIPAAKAAGADVYVTGDIKYHQAEEALSFGMPVIDAGHFATEVGIAAVFADYLRGHLNAEGEEVEVLVSSVMRDAFTEV